MCGVVSALALEGGFAPADLERALAALRHRGPDGEGRWISPDGQVGLAHSRLAVIDPATGAQPMVSEHGVVLVVNGELYDFERLRRELRDRGHEFRTGSDSEVILRLYEEHDLDFLSRLRGEFALVLWDGPRRRLLAARDRFGVRPLRWAEHQGVLWIASEAKALFAAGLPRAWDRAAAFHAFSLQYVPPDRTLFEGIHQLRPGHMLLVEDGRIEERRWWDLDLPRLDVDRLEPEPGLRERFLEALSESVRLRLRSDAPLAFYLSGGLDSASVLALAAQERPGATAFTVGFDEETYDEAAQATEIAHRLGAEHVILRLDRRELARTLGEAVVASEGLAVNGHLPAKYLLARAIREAGFKVVLTGEGSDELLAGYPHLRRDLVLEGEAGDLEGLLASNQVSEGIMLSHDRPTLPLDAVAGRLGWVPSFLEAKAALGLRMHALFSEDFREEVRGADGFGRLMDSLAVEDQLEGRRRIDASTYIWSKLTLANYILSTLGDGAEMAHALESRPPFLDHELFALTRRMPLTAKIRDGVEKHILRDALRDRLPESVTDRQKHPFYAPPLAAGDGGALALVRESLEGGALDDVPFFDRDAVRDLLTRAPELEGSARRELDPMLVMLTSCAHLQAGYGLSEGRSPA